MTRRLTDLEYLEQSLEACTRRNLHTWLVKRHLRHAVRLLKARQNRKEIPIGVEDDYMPKESTKKRTNKVSLSDIIGVID